MFSVFIPRFPARASRVPHCNRSRLIAFIVLTGFRNRKLMDGASLSPVYFVSACFLPGHLSVRSAFICHSTYDAVFLTAYFFIIIIFPSLRCPFLFDHLLFHHLPNCPFAAKWSFPCSIRRIVFISYRSPSRLSTLRVPLSSRFRVLQFLFPESVARVLLHFRAHCRALSIHSANYEQQMGRFADSESVITMFAAIIHFRRNY